MKRSVVVSTDGVDALAVRSMVYLALSYDQRIIDGADAARFLAGVKGRLEGGAFESDLGICRRFRAVTDSPLSSSRGNRELDHQLEE